MLNLLIDGLGVSCEHALWSHWTLLMSVSVQVMAWCRQASSHYLSQCWPMSVSPYGITRPQWVNRLRPSDAIRQQKIASTLQCLKLMVAQSPLATKNLAGPLKFDPGQVKIIIDYIRREIFLTFLGDWEKILVWNTDIGSGNGLLPDGTKPLPEPMLTHHQ